MKVIYPVCCGVDVHKTFLVATLITSKGLTPHYSKKRFSTFNNSILQFKQWLLDNNCFDVCMESTRKYWIPVHNLLEDKIRITVANPKWVKAVKGNKDDVNDSKWIGDLFRLGLVPGSYIPPKPIRILREYTRYRYKLVSCKSSEKNRFQNAFTVCNVALDAVFSDMFGKSAYSITDYLISCDSFDPKHCSTLLQKSLKKKADIVNESIEGYQMTKEQKERILMIRSHLEFVQKSISKLDEKLNEMVAAYYKNKYERICKRRGKKRAIIAIARMILTAIYNIFVTGEEWNPCDLFKIDMPQEMLEKQKQKAIKQAAKLLISQGIIKASDVSVA